MTGDEVEAYSIELLLVSSFVSILDTSTLVRVLVSG